MNTAHATKRTWPDGTRHRGRLIDTSLVRAAGGLHRVQVVEDLDARHEGHVLMGNECCDAAARPGDEGTLTMVHDKRAPLGAYWQFARDA